MYIKKVLILIEQGLQQVGVFAYSDFLPEEVDLQINKALYALIGKEIEPLKLRNSPLYKRKIQAFLDRFQNLEVKEFAQTPSAFDDNVVYVPLAEDYVHLISDLSIVLIDCSGVHVETGTIKTGQFYKVKGGKAIIYNGQTYVNGTIFQGVNGISGYTFSGVGTLLLTQLKKQKVANRLTDESLLYETLKNELEKTSPDSPVSSLTGNKLYTYSDESFSFYKVYQTYIRKPKVVNSQFKLYSNSDTLVVGKVYEPVSGTARYNDIWYNPFESFTAINGFPNVTSGLVRLKDDGDLELTETMCYEVINKVITELAIISEQSQQKITNLVQKDV